MNVAWKGKFSLSRIKGIAICSLTINRRTEVSLARHFAITDHLALNSIKKTSELSTKQQSFQTKHESELKQLPLKEIQQNKFNSGSNSSGKLGAQNVIHSNKVQEAKRKRHPFTVSVEGNIGSGKSTFLKYFSSLPDVTTFQEPVNKWTNVGGHNLLQKLYEDPKRWNFLFQSYVQLTRLNIHLQSSSNIKLIERSFHNNRFCFVENDYLCGHLKREEYEILCEYYDVFEKIFNIDMDLIVYLRTTPEVVYERMKNRGRTEEANIPLEYMKKVHNSHENWLIEGKPKPAPSRVITINGDLDMVEIVKEYEKHKPQILGFNL